MTETAAKPLQTSEVYKIFYDLVKYIDNMPWKRLHEYEERERAAHYPLKIIGECQGNLESVLDNWKDHKPKDFTMTDSIIDENLSIQELEACHICDRKEIFIELTKHPYNPEIFHPSIFCKFHKQSACILIYDFANEKEAIHNVIMHWNTIQRLRVKEQKEWINAIDWMIVNDE